MIRRLGFGEEAAPYESEPQKVRFWTENWASENLYCPACGADSLTRQPANQPASDFTCPKCDEEFELKSTRGRIPPRVVDGAYDTLMARLAAKNNPSLAVLRYDRADRVVRDLQIIPKHFFVPAIVERRKPLAPTARRAGWVGSNILLADVPAVGRISVVRDGLVTPREQVVAQWAQTRFLLAKSLERRGWLIEVMSCIVDLGVPEFALADVYRYEADLAAKYPDNENVRPKIRQQLQVLRDSGYLTFLGDGRYRLSHGVA